MFPVKSIFTPTVLHTSHTADAHTNINININSPPTSGGTGGVKALDAAGADLPADRHAADGTRAGAQQGRPADTGCSQLQAVRRHGALRAPKQRSSKILYMGDLMVHKVIKRMRAGRERRFGEPYGLGCTAHQS